MRVDERCSCGATFQARGLTAGRDVAVWRMTHPCPNGNGTKWTAKPTFEETSNA